MKNLIHTLICSAHCLSLFVVSAALLFTTGCGNVENAKNDEEPTLASYVVTVSPSSRELEFGVEDEEIQTSVEIAGQCVGEFIPQECATFKPSWGYTWKSTATLLSLTFDDSGSPRTIAHLVVKRPAFAENAMFDRGSVPGFVNFFTTKEPVNVGHTRRGAVLNLNMKFRPLKNFREETSPTKGVVTFAPGELHAVVTGNNSSATLETTVNYTGPATTLRLQNPRSRVGYLGSDLKFTILYPPPTYSLPANGSVGLIIRCDIAPGDFRQYWVDIVGSVDSGEGADGIARVSVQGEHTL